MVRGSERICNIQLLGGKATRTYNIYQLAVTASTQILHNYTENIQEAVKFRSKVAL
jgi:hypothetical protein